MQQLQVRIHISTYAQQTAVSMTDRCTLNSTIYFIFVGKAAVLSLYLLTYHDQGLAIILMTLTC